MIPTVVRSPQRRRSETPNAVMTTLASPTQGPTEGLSAWQIAMEPGQQGPLHAFDREQIWYVLEGEADFRLDDNVVRLQTGDVAVLPADVERRVTAVTAVRIVACGPADTSVTAAGEDAPRGTPPWIA